MVNLFRKSDMLRDFKVWAHENKVRPDIWTLLSWLQVKGYLYEPRILTDYERNELTAAAIQQSMQQYQLFEEQIERVIRYRMAVNKAFTQEQQRILGDLKEEMSEKQDK